MEEMAVMKRSARSVRLGLRDPPTTTPVLWGVRLKNHAADAFSRSDSEISSLNPRENEKRPDDAI